MPFSSHHISSCILLVQQSDSLGNFISRIWIPWFNFHTVLPASLLYFQMSVLIVFLQKSFIRHLAYRHISFYCASQISLLFVCFFIIEGLWEPCIKQVYGRYFSKSIIFQKLILWLCVSHFGNSPNISNFFIIILFL